MKVEIYVPIWNGEKVGIAEKYLADGSPLEVKVLYKDTSGKFVFPHTYLMSAEKAKQYPVRPRNGKVPPLYLIPIKDFEVKQAKVEKRYIDMGNGVKKEIIIHEK